MRVIALDTETARFRPGVMAPELACLSAAFPHLAPALYHATDAEKILEAWLRSDCVFVGHFMAYDMAVICANFPRLVPLVFAAYDADRVTDVKIRQQLLDIAAGHFPFRPTGNGKVVRVLYDLASVTKRLTGRVLAKEDTWRKRYSELIPLPLSQWPQDAKDYAIGDAEATLDDFEAQEKHAETYLKDQFRQARHSFWLHLTSVWGLRTRPEGVAALEAQTAAALEEVRARLQVAGLVRKDGSRDTKAAKARMIQVCAELEIKVPETDKGNVCLDADACEATLDEILEDYADLTSLGTVISKDVAALSRGMFHPVHTRFDLAATGRTTSSSPNVQNWRRLPGIRECFVPRPGKVFVQADYDGLELRTLAQVCLDMLGKSELAIALNAGLDVHTELACSILGISYKDGVAAKKAKDKKFDDARQTAKVANFGFPGGLGFKNLIKFARKTYGVILSENEAKELKRAWLARWPEMSSYFAQVGMACNNEEGLAQFTHLYSDRIRGGATYCAACNGPFQGLGADASKRAGWLLSRACYAEQASPLFGTRIVNYIHDEFFGETDDTPAAHDVAQEWARLMIKGANEFLPDVPATTEPILMRFWSKEAQAVFGPDGRLIPWEGKAAA